MNVSLFLFLFVRCRGMSLADSVIVIVVRYTEASRCEPRWVEDVV